MSEGKEIRNVSDTALWVAIYRAMESERKDALFRDPYARRLGGSRGEAIVARMPGGKATAWPMIVRTAVMDEIIKRCIAEGARCVLNLAAGLDARPYRLDLPADLRWFHVDFPDMVDYFCTHMQGETPRCALEFVRTDLRISESRREVFQRAAQHGPVLIISEGLLIYLESDEVASLAADLNAFSGARWWLTDLASPLLLRFLAKRWQPMLQNANAPFRFGPAEGTDFFAPFGWREREFRSSWDESFRLKRTMRFAGFWRLMSRLQPVEKREKGRRMSAIVLLENSRL